MEIASMSDELEHVVESFLASLRASEQPSIEEYATRYPNLAGQIRGLFPTLLIVEQDLSVGDEEGISSADRLTTIAPRQLGDYLILREIGRGGMGVVYEAVQQSLGRHVALKVMSWSNAENSIHAERFQLEARAAARLHHTNIVPVFGVGVQDGTRYFAMQYIRGHGLDVIIEKLRELRFQTNLQPVTNPLDLARRVAKRLLTGQSAREEPSKSITPNSDIHDERSSIQAAQGVSSSKAEAIHLDSIFLSSHADVISSEGTYFRRIARVALQVAEALEYAHKQGVIHRDIKPSNLMIDARGTVWITDFGLARTEGSDGPTRTGEILGTLRYMAPEQFKGESSASSDLYSLGATLYELLTLRPLFDETSRPDLIDKVLRQEPQPMRVIEPKIPHDLEVICLKCLHKEPAGRYASLEELSADLCRYLAGETIKARPVSVLWRGWRWCRRNSALASSLCVVMAALMVVTAVSLVYAERQARDASQIQELALQKSGESIKAREEAQRAILRLTILEYERGQMACERGELGPGLLHLIASWRAAVSAGDQQWQNTARASLSVWHSEYRGPQAIVSHQGSIPVVAYSPDGMSVLTASNDSTASIWNAVTAQRIGLPLQHQSSVAAAAFSPDGKRVVTGSADRTARLWDAANGNPIGQPMQHQGYVTSVAFSPDGKSVITGGFDKMARIWDAMSGQPVGQPLPHQKEVNVVQFSPNGKMILTACEGTVQLWDTSTGKPIGKPMPHPGIVMNMTAVFSSEGETVLTSGYGNAARLWDATTGLPVGPSFQHQRVVGPVAFSPDGKRVLTGSYDKTARIWNATTGELVGQPLQHQGYVRAVAFSPDGTQILTGSYDKTARLWDASSGKPIGSPMPHQGLVRAVAFSPDGRNMITSSDDGAARIWEIAAANSSNRIVRHDGGCSSSAFSPDGKSFITGSIDKSARVWDAITGLPISPPLRNQDFVYAVAFSPDGKTVLTGSADGVAQLWDPLSGQPIGAPWMHERSVTSLAFSPDGESAISGSNDLARIWEVRTGLLIYALPYDAPVTAVAFSPDGKTILTGSLDQTARLWDAAKREMVGPPLQHQGFVYAVAFSPDGETIFTGCADGNAQLWDRSTGQRAGAPLKHQGWVRSVAFSPDGKIVVTACFDGTARFWETSTGRPISALNHQDAVLSVAISRDGKTVLTTSADRTARLSKLTELPDDLERVANWVEVVTGLTIGDNDSVGVLDNTTWLGQRERAIQNGGAP